MILKVTMVMMMKRIKVWTWILHKTYKPMSSLYKYIMIMVYVFIYIFGTHSFCTSFYMWDKILMSP